MSRLALGDANVGELAEPFSISLPAISKHLRVLEDAGLMVRHKQGRIHQCHLRADPLEEAVDWIEEARRFWDDRLDALAQFLEQPNQASGTKKEPKND